MRGLTRNPHGSSGSKAHRGSEESSREAGLRAPALSKSPGRIAGDDESMPAAKNKPLPHAGAGEVHTWKWGAASSGGMVLLQAGTVREVNGKQGGKGNSQGDADMSLGATDETKGAGVLGIGHGLGVEDGGQARGRDATRPEARNTTMAEESAGFGRLVGDVNALGDAFTGGGVCHRSWCFRNQKSPAEA